MASISEDEDFVISGSEDGKLCMWNKVSKYAPAINPAYASIPALDSLGTTRTTMAPSNTSSHLVG